MSQFHKHTHKNSQNCSERTKINFCTKFKMLDRNDHFRLQMNVIEWYVHLMWILRVKLVNYTTLHIKCSRLWTIECIAIYFNAFHLPVATHTITAGNAKMRELRKVVIFVNLFRQDNHLKIKTIWMYWRIIKKWTKR